MSKIDNFVGLVGVAVGILGVGYALGTHSKMAKIGERLDRSIEELAGNTPVDIPNDMIERAVEKAVAHEVKQAVSKVSDRVIVEVKNDIHKQVSDAVESEYSNIKGCVLEELTAEAAKIDVKRVRADVEKAAKEHAIEKFDDNLDDILTNFKYQLNNTSRIYNSIADSMTGYKSVGRETVLRIG
jgi:phenylalanyl-tRNA synthetase alpha subunit